MAQRCTLCERPSIPGLVQGGGKCQAHWDHGAHGTPLPLGFYPTATVRSLCGRARVDYSATDSTWHVSFGDSINAGAQYATLRDALRMLEAREFRFPSTTVRTRYRAYVARRQAYGFPVGTFREWYRWVQK